MMAPPDRGDYPRRSDSLDVLADLRIDEGADSRLTRNAGRLASWVEWLHHPEEHDYDRTVTYPDGTKREESKRVTKANQTPGHYEPVDLPFESVIARFSLEQFLDGMAAFATQRVERPDSQLALGAGAVKNVWWLGNARMLELVHQFPTKEEWDSAAAERARTFIGEMATAVTQLNKIAGEFADLAPRYALIVKGARDNLDRAAAQLVAAFEKKFSEKPPALSFDIKGVVVAAIGGAITALFAPVATLPMITTAAMGSAWLKMFDEATKVLSDDARSRGTIEGFWWIDLAKTYLRAQADILADAISSLGALADDYRGLVAQFDRDVRPLLEKYAT
jgi:hypothetical protein